LVSRYFSALLCSRANRFSSKDDALFKIAILEPFAAPLLQLLELLFLTPRDPLTQLAQLGMRGFAGTCLDRLRGIGMMVLVFLEEFSFEFLTLQPSELKRNIVGTWELLAVPILQPCSHSLDTLAVLLVNSRAKVAQFFSYRFIFCARVNHPVIVVVGD
jgi:hypothetical protein